MGIDLSGSDVPEARLAEEFLSEFEASFGRDMPLLETGSSSKKIFTLYYSEEAVGEQICSSSVTSFLDTVRAHEALSQEDAPIKVFRKPYSTLALLLRDLSSKSVSAALTTAPTGPLVMAAVHELGRFSPLRHPPLIVELPSPHRDRPILLLDAGAHPQLLEHDIVLNAFLGVAYVRALYGDIVPKVAILNMGEEPLKGPEELRHAYAKILTANDTARCSFIGNCEPCHIFLPDAPDVVVTSGFAGNILLKTIEAVAQFANIDHTLVSNERALRMKAALLGGLKGLVYKCHGKASGRLLYEAAVQTLSFVATREKFVSRFEEEFTHFKSLLDALR